MASGVGSGSMMAAASGAIAAQVDKQTADSVMALAAASNLLTTTFGTYFTLFISLPLAVASYKILEPILGKWSKKSTAEQVNDEQALKAIKEASIGLSWSDKIIAWFATAVLSSVANWIAFGHISFDVLAACLILILVSLLGDIVYKLTRRKIPTVCWVSVIAMFATSPWCPWAKELATLTGSINMLSIITPMLTFAGLSIAKDLPAFRKLGWRIVVVSFVANLGTFIGAAIIAEFFH